jgi:ribosomal protein L37E
MLFIQGGTYKISMTYDCTKHQGDGTKNIPDGDRCLRCAEEAHATVDNYCCACGYDIAGFEERLKEAREEERAKILKMIDDLPDMDPRGVYKRIDAHRLVGEIQGL